VSGPVNPYADHPARPGYGPQPSAPPPPPAPGRDEPSGGEEPVFRHLCALMVRTQVTRVRVGAVLGLGILAVLSGAAYGNGVRTGQVIQPLIAGSRWINDLGLAFVVPVASLLFASSMFGDPNEDKTLVYLWLRPVSRGRLVMAAAVTSFLVTWPLVVPALAATAATTGGGRALVLATIVAATIGVAANTGVFVALGARVKLPLVWGLLYILLWEKYVGTATSPTMALSLRQYLAVVLNSMAGTNTSKAEAFQQLPVVVAALVPLALAAGSLLYARRRLTNQDVA
jgi:ABC-2 type transport system permease protein